MVERQKKSTDIFQEFFTNSEHILNYMVTLLDVESGNDLLEPCAGHGAFIDKLLESNNSINIDAYDLNKENIEFISEKYSDPNIYIKHLDFLLLENYNKKYDRILANPPYGAYQTEEKRNYLKNMYPDLYAKETYGIFLIHSLKMLKDNGRLVFIIPDTYLNLHMHKGLRKRLLFDYTIESITLFPSKYFPGVNFGYAGLSIISIIKSFPQKQQSFPVYGNFTSKADFYDVLNQSNKSLLLGTLKYNEILHNPSFAFFLPDEKWISELFKRKILQIGEISNVVTGFYSGNDGYYLKRIESVTRGSKKYEVVPENKICKERDSISLDGINCSKHYIPIVKGGNRRFYKPSEWYMDWSSEAIYDFKVTNKKRARFQNSSFYFKQGLAIPMVSSSAITASLIENRLFDQSIVGLFLKSEYNHLIHYLLGFFNSEVCNKVIRTINPSTNNSANYIKKIPIVLPTNDQLIEINQEVYKLYNLAKNKIIETSDLFQLNKLINMIYKDIPSSPSMATTEDGGEELFATAL